MAAKLTKGDRIPYFSLVNQASEMVHIQELVGQPLVIYFYPKDDTPGCTAQACSFRDSFEDFQDAGVMVIGISADDPKTHQRFAEKHRLPFILLSDRNNKVRKQFGVPGSLFGLLPGRVTYVVNSNGIVVHVFNSQLHTTAHVKEALKALNLK